MKYGYAIIYVQISEKLSAKNKDAQRGSEEVLRGKKKSKTKPELAAS